MTKLTAAAMFACALGLAVTGCGDQKEATATSGTVTAPADSSIPVVGGVSPQSQAPTSEDTSAAADEKNCGMTGGPDGALHVRLAAGDVTCKTAMSIAKDYSPLIATGKPQTVSGWNCGPSSEENELARCTKDGQAIAFTVN